MRELIAGSWGVSCGWSGMELLAHLGAGLVFGASLGQSIPFSNFFCLILPDQMRIRLPYLMIYIFLYHG